jgi:hypothetical protein
LIGRQPPLHIVIAVARGKGDSSKHRKNDSPDFHRSHLCCSLFYFYCFHYYKRCEARNPVSLGVKCSLCIISHLKQAALALWPTAARLSRTITKAVKTTP